MRRKILFLTLVAALALVVAAPAYAAGPLITDLASPTHPDQYNGYYSNDPEFTWSATPGPLGWCDTPGFAYDLAVAGGVAYVADDYGSGLKLIDVGTPSTPLVQGSFWTDARAYDVAVVDDLAYVAMWNGLSVVDVSDAATPVSLGWCWTPDWGCDVDVVGSYAYLPCDTQGFRAFNVSDPYNPYEVGSCSLPGRPWGVDVVGNLAYVATENGLSIVDVTDPANMTTVGGLWSEWGWCSQVSVAGGVAYLISGCAIYGAGTPGLHVIDVSDPAAPTVLGSCSLPDYADGLCIDGATAYVADGSQGVQVVDVSDPHVPMVVKELDTLGTARGVVLDGGYLYVADGENGLVVLDPSAETPLPTAYRYSYAIDQVSDTSPDDVEEGTTPAASFTDLADGTWWFHVRAADDDGVWGSAAHYQINIDHRPRITSLWSPTHPYGGWTANDDPQFAYLTDVSCDAYSYALDQVDGQEPDTIPDPVSDLDHPLVSFADVADGQWWFHVRARDREGNWGPAVQFSIAVKADGPVTMAMGTKSTRKRSGLFLVYSVYDEGFRWYYWPQVVIQIRRASGEVVREIDCGQRELEQVYSLAVTPALPRGHYTYTVHAWDWLGNPESQTGTAGFTVR